MQDVIRVENLTKKYKDVIAVDGVNFTIKKGTCFGLLGPNGAGKTTTIEIMEGIIKASEGQVYYYDKAINAAMSQQIGIQFQHTALQDFLSVQETLNLFTSFYQHTIAISELVELCDLSEFLNRDNRLLSGGQRQRLLLALALINDPDIVFLDEPTTGLDPQARRNFWQLIKNIKARDKTVVLTTHYMDEAQQLCDDVLIMDHGKVIARGSPRQLLNQHFQEVFISLPAIQVPDALVEHYGWHINAQQVEITTADVEATLSLLLAKKISLTGLHIKSPNLDDLFLKLTGHSLRD
ncbi:ABC-2 type transport system ATP-binding protein [Colwellia chukchiensis]|uniref:ABC-2 type transport system ATP-binding protein n=1 Tax=Colwellia chukchiensis TaxID=641665 RepID=A0A1H7IS80_9GAMM|nr:ABC transporter ATP-binding protein [Colwellia chukchiensis]SEK64567.1 ABC-2 type transport system ATP-binding protein [Colwellia chukchiensis]